MNGGSKGAIAGIVLSEQQTVTLDELAGLCTVERSWVIELVEQGALEPLGPESEEWSFSAAALGRVRTAARLRRDLELDTAGIALALELLDEIDWLRARLRSLEDLS